MPSHQTVEVLPDGALRSRAGMVYRRTSVRVKRKNGRELVGAGADVVTDVYPDGLTWFDGSDAVSTWNEIEPRLVTGAPPPATDLQWVGRVWESESGAVLLYFVGDH
ncbi:hypothetical protein ACOACO_03705 [Nocardioides sp. CPCC 205120]|uniref:hypothetical protein n=1 Tax=Nocardioides sp. CPCC 205120 TaxID=3406462 RepID=UPI003B514AB4